MSMIKESEVEFSAIRSQGAGGQNVNKVSSAVHLRFDIHASSLPDNIKQKLLHYRDDRISKDGVITIKAQNHRQQLKNKQDALQRLESLVEKASYTPRQRIPTRPTKASKKRRLDNKNRRGATKQLRQRPATD